MHSHIHAIGPNQVNPYSARALEKGDAAQRAADVRKKLVGTSGEIEVEADSGEDWLVGQGYEGASQRGTRQQSHPEKKKVLSGEPGEFIEPLSVWA